MTETPSKRFLLFTRVSGTSWGLVFFAHLLDRTLFVGLLDISTLPDEPRLRTVFESLLISSALVGIAWFALAYILLSELLRYLPGQRDLPKLPHKYFLACFILLLVLSFQLFQFFGFAGEPHGFFRIFPKAGALAISFFAFAVACPLLGTVVDRKTSIERLEKAERNRRHGQVNRPHKS